MTHYEKQSMKELRAGMGEGLEKLASAMRMSWR